MEARSLVWLRRDLRLDDQPAIAAALDGAREAVLCFCLDERIHAGEDRAPVRLRFLLEGLGDLDRRLRELGGGLTVVRGDARIEIPRLALRLGVSEVHACSDEEPAALARDAAVEAALADHGITLHRHHDQTLVPHDQVSTLDGTPCKTYSSYARAVGRVLAVAPALPFDLDLRGRLALPDRGGRGMPTPDELALRGPATPWPGGETYALERLRAWRDVGLPSYAGRRDDLLDPAATSHLSAYLKLGMLSPRRARLVADRAGAAKWRSELLWRDWFKYVLHHHPRLADRCVDPRFDRVQWPGTDAHFEAWTRGETGFPIVDAGMRQLAGTGFLPNRVRMIAISLLVKHLHVDWRRGERWFRDHLVDGDLSSNAGSVQWVAGTGLDAAPYFRVFNPLLQQRKFDPDGAYARRWAADGPQVPIVDIDVERVRALALYGVVTGDRGTSSVPS